MPTSFDDLKKKASLATSSLPLCMAGDLVEELERLEREYAEAKPARNLGDTAKRDLAEKITHLQDEMRDATVEFRLKALPARAWSKFQASLPAQKENEPAADWDERIFPHHAELVSRTVVDPAMTVEQIMELVEEHIHGATWNRLANACWFINRRDVDIPNSAAASDLIGTSD